MTTPEIDHQTIPVETLSLHGKTALIDLQANLPDKDPANRLLADADITGRALVDITAGNQRFVVADVSAAPQVIGGSEYSKLYEPFGGSTRVGAESPTRYRLDTAAPHVLFHFAADGTVTGRAVELGSPILLGRTAHREDPKSARFPYKGDPDLDTRHFGLVSVYEGGMYKLLVHDESQQGTEVRYGLASDEELQDARRARQAAKVGSALVIAATDVKADGPVKRGPSIPLFERARAMEPDELWAEVNNGDRTHDIKYIEHYRQARAMVVDSFKSGELYSSRESFEKVFKEIHAFLGQTGDYNRHNGAKLDTEHFGVFRGSGRVHSGRLEGAQQVADIAYRYKDPYGTDRLWHGPIGMTHTSFVQLPGISPENLPYDVVHYGNANAKHGVGDQDYYRYSYPEGGEGLDEYMEQIVKLGQQIEQSIKEGNANVDHMLQLIGRQYQYGACARPAVNINNSIFMQFANAQTKMLGFPGMTHGRMDLAAQRMQPHTFARYFAARARHEEQ